MDTRPFSRTLAIALALTLACITITPSSAWAAGKAGDAVVLASLEWPPYTGQSLTGYGISAEVVRQAFQQSGVSLEVHFFPWARAVAMARTSADIAGYFPEYRAPRIEHDFIFSDSIGKSPLGFAELVDAPVQWESLQDLKELTIGTVQGYVNTEEFDRMVKAGELCVEKSPNDLTNLRMLLGGRVQLAVIDENVFRYLLATAPELAASQKKLRFNGRILEMKELFVCFRKSDEGERLAKLFKEGLSKVDARSIEAEALKAAMRPAR